MNLYKQAVTLALAGGLSFAATTGADAATILSFAQSGSGSPIVATRTGSSTTIVGTDIEVTISGIDAALSLPITAYFNLDALSSGSAVFNGGPPTFYSQPFSGTFSITSQAGGLGTNYLSGTYTDAVFGIGNALTMQASEPFNTVTFTTDVISTLGSPRALAFSFANVNPAVGITDDSLNSFTASVTGTLSAERASVPEPTSMTLAGLGMLGAAFAARRRRR